METQSQPAVHGGARHRAFVYAYHHLLPLSMLAFCLLRCTAVETQSQPAGEAELLLQMKHAWGDPPVLAAWNWSDATSAVGAHCRWPYVGCDRVGRVTSLHLCCMDLTGPVPDAVGDFSGLEYLELFHNNITGMFPTALYRCRSLRYLDLAYNYLEGELPSDIGQGLGTNLSTLHLDSNMFNSSIPISLGELTSLRAVGLGDNPFHPGELPASFMNLTHLVGLYARGCSLVGTIPSYLTKMMHLEELLLGNNSLIGAIPPGIWGLKNLRFLDVHGNNLTGNVVVDDFAAFSLKEIHLSDNKLSGTIPEVFGRLKNLEYLVLDNNNFSGDIPMSISWLPSLVILLLTNNTLTGELPPELGKHASGLAYVDIAYNDLTGRIPEGICAGGQLEILTASGNRLNGAIPVGLANCTALSRLELGDNQLSGEIPTNFGYGMLQLQTLNLANNKLSGRIS